MAPLTDFPELLRLAADLLNDPPRTQRIVEADDISKSGVDPSGPAGRLLGDLILSAPVGPDATHDTLTRGALAHGLRLLADSRLRALVDGDPMDHALLSLAGAQLLEKVLTANLVSNKPATIELVNPPSREAIYAGLLKIGITPSEDLRGPCGLLLELLLGARTKVAQLERAAQKRQATIDRQGNELGRLRAMNQRLDQENEVARLQTWPLVRRLVSAAYKATMAWLKAEPGQSWVRLLADNKASDVPGLAAAYEAKLGAEIIAAVRASLVHENLSPEDKPHGFPPVTAAERDEDGCALCTHCRRERAAGRPAVQGCSDCLWLNEGEQEREAGMVALTTPAGLADLDMEGMTRAALQGFALPPEMLGVGGRIELMPESDPAICKALGLHLDRPLTDEERRDVLARTGLPDMPPSVVVGETECGPPTPSRTIRSGDDGMSPMLLNLAADLLDMASEVFSNHGCNDFKMAGRFTDEDLAAIADLMNRSNLGDDYAVDYGPDDDDVVSVDRLREWAQDDHLMDAMAHGLRVMASKDTVPHAPDDGRGGAEDPARVVLDDGRLIVDTSQGT